MYTKLGLLSLDNRKKQKQKRGRWIGKQVEKCVPPSTMGLAAFNEKQHMGRRLVTDPLEPNLVSKENVESPTYRLIL